MPGYKSEVRTEDMSVLTKYLLQIKLLLWKRYTESIKDKWELLKLVMPPLLFFTLLLLLYSLFDFFSPGGIERFIVPFGFWIFIQRLVILIMYEKSTRLQESMRMTGLLDLAYWTSYFISDGVILGFVLSLLCTIMSRGGLFNNADFGSVLGLLFLYCLSAVPFSYSICAFFDSPQTASQFTLVALMGLYVLDVVFFTKPSLMTMGLKQSQIVMCLFPPMALQEGSGAFVKSYDGLSIGSICGMMFADIFIYSALAWYFWQVWPSKVGVPKPWYFVVDYNYWFPAERSRLRSRPHYDQQRDVEEPSDVEGNTDRTGGPIENSTIPVEVVNEKLLGSPTVEVSKLRKTFGSQVSVNDLSFKMYENQIFALLGHNGAGKTTTINMLTGMLRPDYSMSNILTETTIYGRCIHSEMDQIRYSLGVCPQHDVLFDNLTVREHILFFAQLKGASFEAANEDATKLTTLFHLEERLDHLGGELSGGQRRKLSVAIAVCGGSKFIVLDEPTAGMDPMARRELWDLLAGLRKGRTMLLTTHYMDEADILGDRVGIMSLGQMQCVGSTQFLKSTYGTGYKLVFDKVEGMDADQLGNLTSFVKAFIPEAQYFEEDGADTQAMYSLPFSTVGKFGKFFTGLEKEIHSLAVTAFGVNITSLEEVFLKVGGDHTVEHLDPTVTATQMKMGVWGQVQQQQSASFQSSFIPQVIGIVKRKLMYCLNDFITIPLLGLPIAVFVCAAVIYKLKLISNLSLVNDLAISAIYMGGFLGAPGLISEFIVRERNDKLRNLLTVMGCDFRAYWLGTFIADFMLMFIPLMVWWITWGAAGMKAFHSGSKGICFLVTLLFVYHLLGFSYLCSFMFSSSKVCISFMPIFIILLLITPNIVLLIIVKIMESINGNISDSSQGTIYFWGTLLLSPHGALLTGLLDGASNLSTIIETMPSIGDVIAVQICEGTFFLLTSYYIDSLAVIELSPSSSNDDPTFDPSVLENLDEDVTAERVRTATLQEAAPLVVSRLRKVFPPKVSGRSPVIATEDVSFVVNTGEIFGLLGANGAGKTTTLSMLTRHLVPTSGNAFIVNHSILSDFSKGATHLGVVTQNNSLWDRLSVEAHLFLFARLRGVPEDLVKQVVDGTIDQLELTPHRHKLAMRLSGGMKRKLCVAIALIGDPEVVLLDEPSAGLDPVSRRNLWSVILRTMSHRAVILTTHSMDEAEALCKRIGIMVHGQLRALGTKQHLKNKFGSGFELVVKLQVTNLEEQLSALSDFVTSLFPSSTMISENGGLVTYKVPKEEMKMGVAFSELEENKMRLSIEDYSVAQPTLEQVFIKTISDYSAKTSNSSSTAIEVGEGDALRPAAAAEVVRPLNYCGCTDLTTGIMAVVCTVFFILFWVIATFALGGDSIGGFIFFLLSTISLIIAITGCVLRCCSCCKPPADDD